jgi:uncharacterized SAM-binding protein YcdF (DUF218 family)
LSWKVRALSAGILLVIGVWIWAYVARRLAPVSNTNQARFDAIVVLGDPADSDGNPTPTELARVTEAVHEYERGVAGHLIFTGGAVHNQFVEAQVMARTAESQGIPENAVVVESSARNTIENACYSVRLMRQRGWESAEVVSSPWHLQRAGLIFSRMPIKWRVQGAPALEPNSDDDTRGFTETLKTVRYLIWGRPIEQCEP